MATGKRRKFSADEKVCILKKHFVDKKPVSDICDDHGLHPTLFYRWQQQLFSDAASVFEKKYENTSLQLKRKVAELEEKLSRKHEVLSELLEEHIVLKKNLGER